MAVRLLYSLIVALLFLLPIIVLAATPIYMVTSQSHCRSQIHTYHRSIMRYSLVRVACILCTLFFQQLPASTMEASLPVGPYQNAEAQRLAQRRERESTAATPIRLLRGVAQDADLDYLDNFDDDLVMDDNEYNNYDAPGFSEQADILPGPTDTGVTADSTHNVTGDPRHIFARAEVQRGPVSTGATDPTKLAQIAIPVPTPLDKKLKAINFRGDRPLIWESVNGEVRLNGLPFHIKGVNFFGFETDTRVFHGLDTHTLDFYLDFLRAEDFNLLRLPISLAAALDLDSYPRYHYFQDPVLRGKTVRQLLELVIDEAGARGIMVLLDMHRARENEKFELWYTKEYSYETLLDGWHRLLGAFKHRWNVMGVDLLNEPHGAARWETGDRGIDWNRAAEDMIMKLMQAYPEYTGLFFVEGVSNDYPYICFWGANMEGVARKPLDVRGNGKWPNGNKRIVYSPHTYGPSVDNQPYFNAPDYPRNLPKIWDALFGFVEQATGNAVVMGEWGGFYRNKTKLFIDEFALYLLERCMSDNIYWVLNPHSADTGGLLENDWTTPKRHRLKVLQTVQPFPSRLFFDGKKFVYKPGAYANRECDPRWRIWEEQERQRLREGGYDVEWEEAALRPAAQNMRHPHTLEEEKREAAMVREWVAYEED